MLFKLIFSARPSKFPIYFAGDCSSECSWAAKRIRDGSRTAATFKMKHFVVIVNGWRPLTIITKSSIFNVAARSASKNSFDDTAIVSLLDSGTCCTSCQWVLVFCSNSELYLEPTWTSKMKFFAKIGNDFYSCLVTLVRFRNCYFQGSLTIAPSETIPPHVIGTNFKL